jgi:uracil phosphoribosyltransferase
VTDTVPILVLRGGLVALGACREVIGSGVGLALPVRRDAGVEVDYLDTPSFGSSSPLLADWIIARGDTLAAVIGAIRRAAPDVHHLVVTCVIACEDGLAQLDRLVDIDVDVVAVRTAKSSAGLLLGFDIGDYALGGPAPRLRWTWQDALPRVG